MDLAVPTDKPTLYLTSSEAERAELIAVFEELRKRRLIPLKMTLNQWVLRCAVERAREIGSRLK